MMRDYIWTLQKLKTILERTFLANEPKMIDMWFEFRERRKEKKKEKENKCCLIAYISNLTNYHAKWVEKPPVSS